MPSVVVSLLHSLRFLARSRALLHLEILALRHQLAVINRTRPPKLADTRADIRILMLERSQKTLDELAIWKEIRRQSKAFPLIRAIKEVWFAETVFYDSSDDPGWRGAVGFHRYNGHNKLTESMQFLHGVLKSVSRNGRATTTLQGRRLLAG